MRFLHTADWHIGKTLNDFSLLDDQLATFKQIGSDLPKTSKLMR